MSVYFDKKKRKYIVRKYILGAYVYIDQCDTKEDADAIEIKWVQDKREALVEDKYKYSPEWFDKTSKQQVKNLHKKYPGFVSGKPHKASREATHERS